MPGFNKKIEQLIAEKNKTAEDDASQMAAVNEKKPTKQLFEEQLRQQMLPPKQPDINEKQFDTSATGQLGDGISNEEAARQQTAIDRSGGDPNAGTLENEYIDPNTWSPESVHASFLEKSAKSLLPGLGTLIGGWGDVITGVDKLLPGAGSLILPIPGEFLKAMGENIREENKRYIPQEMLNPEFNWATFSNPDFWSTHAAEAIPQIVEILAINALTDGAAGMLEGGIKKVVAKELAEGGAEAAFKMGLKGTTKAAWKGAAGIVETPGTGRGLIGKMITDRGTLTNRASEIFKGVTGGAMMNVRVSLGDAGEVYNTYKDAKAPDGSKMFSEEQLKKMSANAFSNNMSYIAYDMLSWGMTFGGGYKKIGQFAKKASDTFSPAIQRKVVGGMFSKAVTPIIQNVGKWGGMAVAEGLEETVQETFEEYAKFKAYKDVAGTWKGYKGVTQDYDNYWDYYASKDSSAIRAISFGAGMAIGGLANMKALVNKNADDSVNLYNRMENLKQFAKKGTEMKTWQDHHVRSTMAELVFDGKEIHFDSFMNNLVNNNGVEQEEQERYQNLFTEMVKAKEDISSMNIKGKKAMMINVTEQMTVQNKMKEEQEYSAKTVSVLNEQLKDNPVELKEQIKKENDNLKNKLIILSKISQNLNDNKVKIITGQKAEAVGFDVVLDENGNEVMVPSNPESNEDGKEKSEPKIPSFTLQNLGEKAKSIFNSFFGSKENENLSKDPTDGETNNNLSEHPTDGETVMDQEVELSDQNDLFNVQPDEDLYIDGERAISHQNNENISVDGNKTVGGFDYQVEPGMVGGEGLTDQDAINASKGTIIAPKTGGFFRQDGTPVKVTKKKQAVQKVPTTQVNVTNTQTNTTTSEPVTNQKKENLNIIKDDSITEIDDAAFENFTEHNEISSGIINRIAEKISQGIKLSDREIAVSGEFNNEIEQKLQEFSKNEQEIEKEDTTGDAKADEFVKKATKRAVAGSKKKTIAQTQLDFENSLENKKVVPPTKDEDPFSGGRSRIPDMQEGVQMAKSTINSVFDKVMNIFKKKGVYFNEMKKDYAKFKGNISNLVNFDDQSDIGSLRIAQQYAVNQKLQLMHPESNISVLAVAELGKVLGDTSLGYALAGSIFIDEKVWNQDNNYMHEIAHVYFPIFKTTPEGQAFLKYSLKNEALVKKVMDLYSNDIEYNIKYPNGETVKLPYWKIKKSNQFSQLSDSSFQEVFDAYIKEGSFTMAPLEDQSVISEEVFVFSLEGPLSEKYNKFFELRNEPTRKFYAKSWWKNIKNRGEKADATYGESQEMFLELLNNKEKTEYKDAKEFILNKFKESVKGKDLSASGRSRLSENIDNETLDRHLTIQDQLASERVIYQGADRFQDDKEINKMQREGLDQLLSENLEEDNENHFEYDRLKYGEKATQIIKDFAKHYNRVLQRAFYIKNKNKSVNWKKESPIFDKENLIVRIMDIATKSSSNVDFIDKIQNSDVEEIAEFNNYLEDMRPDKMMILSTMKFIYGNQSNINPVKLFITEDGKFEAQNALNNKEINLVDRIIDKLYKGTGAWFNQNKNEQDKTSNHRLIEYKEMIDAIHNIKSKAYTEKDLFNFLNYFSVPGINSQAIYKDGYLNINGKPFTINSVVNNVIEKAFTRTLNMRTMDDFSVYDENKNFKPILRTFINSIVATNKKFTSEFTTYNANNKAEPTRVINNSVIREINSMQNDAREMTMVKFLKTYGHVSRNTSEGAQSNALLKFFYNEVQKGNKIELNQHFGIDNQNTLKSSVIKESNDVEESIAEFLTYIDSGNMPTYLMETGRYSDSPTSYMLKVPKLNVKKVGSFSNGNFSFDEKTTLNIKNAHNIYKAMKGEMTMKEFQDSIVKDINEEVEFLSNNNEIFDKIESTKAFFDKGKMNEKGIESVTGYVTNQILNGLYLSEILFPSFNVKNLTKRAKSGRSPGFSFGKHVKVEAIPFISETNNSGIYITQKTADRIALAGGNLMKLGHSFKLLNTGVEKENPTFRGKNIYDKGYFTVLNEAVVKQSPSLKGLHDLMQSREAKYVELNGELQEDILNGMPTQVIYAYPTSSNKSENYPEPLQDKDDNTTEFGNQFELEQINNGNFDEISKTLDNWYYKGNDFIGLQGDNFVVQQVMDKEVHTSNFPIQLNRAILTNAGAHGDLLLREQIQQHIVNQQQQNFAEYRKIMETGTKQEIRKFLTDNMLLEDVDPTQRFALLNDELSITTPILREIAKNTLTNTLRRTGNKLQTDGTVARAKAPTYLKKEGYTNGSNLLAFYTKNSDGSHNQGEVVLPKNMAGRIRQRQYLMFEKTNAVTEEQQALYEERAKSIASNLRTKYGKVTDADGKLTGYYIAGDTIIATRIPSHGPQTTGVFEVVDFDVTDATDAMLPTQFALDITGGDYDGDQYFIQYKGGQKQASWNKAFDMLTKLWLSKEMANEVLLPIDFKEDAEQAIEKVDAFYGEKSFENMVFSPKGRREAFKNTLISKGNIGITANLHSLLGMMSAYEVELMNSIGINGQTAEVFKDNLGTSRTINSAKIFNIIMDNSKWHFADKLGINQHTASPAMILSNLGFSLTDIGLVMNSPVVLEMNRLMSKSDNVFGDKITTQEIEKQVRTKFNIPVQKSNAKLSSTVNFKGSQDEINANVMNLMAQLGTINEEIMKFSAIMQGHTTLETNPFILREQLKSFESVMNNEKNKGIKIPLRFLQNPLIQNYVNVFKFNMKMQEKMDPVFKDDLVEVFDNVSNGLGRTASNKTVKIIHNDIEINNTARMLGLNNVDKTYLNNLLDTKFIGNIYDKMHEYEASLKGNIIEYNKFDVLKSISELDNNLLMTKGLRMSLVGPKRYIATNPSYFNNTLTDGERDRMIEEYEALPVALKNDLMLFDLATTGMKGSRSLFHFYNKNVKKRISDLADLNSVNNTNNLSPMQQTELAQRVVQQNPGILVKYNGTEKDAQGNYKASPFFENDLDSGLSLTSDFLKKHPALFRNMAEGKDTYFTYDHFEKNKKPVLMIAHFKGWSNDDISVLKDINPKDRNLAIIQMAPQNINLFEANQYKNKVGVVAMPDSKTGIPFNYDSRNEIDFDNLGK